MARSVWDRLTGPPDLPAEWGDVELSTGMGPFGGMRQAGGALASGASSLFRSAFNQAPGTARNVGRLAGGTAAGTAAAGSLQGSASRPRPTSSGRRTPSGPPGRTAPHQAALDAWPESSAARNPASREPSTGPSRGATPLASAQPTTRGTGPAEVDHSEHPHAGVPAMGLEDIFDMLFGGGGGMDLDALGQSFDDQIAALNAAGVRFEDLNAEQKANIRSAADTATGNIGGFFDYAAHQANQGRPVIAESGASAQSNLDSIYDELDANLSAIPGLGQEQATAAAGGAGSQVGTRMEAAAAPFRAAGASGRAASKSNVTQHTAAGKDYLSQLAAAAPSEAAMGQQTVEQGAAQAKTAADMALAEQQMALELETARLEGAKQRALLEASADTAGSTFDRFMQGAQLFSALGADPGVLRDSLGLPADPALMGGAEGMSHEDMLDLAIKEARLADMTAPETSGLEGFQNMLSQESPTVQRDAMELLDIVDESGWQQDPTEIHRLIGQLTPENEDTSSWWQRSNAPQAESWADLMEDPEAQKHVSYDPSILRHLFRTLYQ